MLELPTDLPADLAPLSWLLGVWEGTGVIDYTAGDDRFEGEFTHRVSFSHDGGPYLNYAATGWLARAEGEESIPLVAESGFWRIARPAGPATPTDSNMTMYRSMTCSMSVLPRFRVTD